MDWSLNISSVPPIWQWVALVSGLTAMLVAVMALPTVFQMFWGRPKLTFEFCLGEPQRQGERLVLECRIFNRPVKARLLRWLRVEREKAEDVTGAYEILELPLRTRLSATIEPLLYRRGYGVPIDNSPHISLPSSFTAYGFMPIVISSVNGTATASTEQEVQLQPGNYLAKVVILNGASKKEAEQRFVVTTDGMAHWTSIAAK